MREALEELYELSAAEQIRSLADGLEAAGQLRTVAALRSHADAMEQPLADAEPVEQHSNCKHDLTAEIPDSIYVRCIPCGWVGHLESGTWGAPMLQQVVKPIRRDCSVDGCSLDERGYHSKGHPVLTRPVEPDDPKFASYCGCPECTYHSDKARGLREPVQQGRCRVCGGAKYIHVLGQMHEFQPAPSNEAAEKCQHLSFETVERHDTTRTLQCCDCGYRWVAELPPSNNSAQRRPSYLRHFSVFSQSRQPKAR